MKFIVCIFCLAIALLLYFIYFETSFLSTWSAWPGPPSISNYEGNWLEDFLLFLVTNKISGGMLVLCFVCSAFSAFSVQTCKKCGSPEISYGEPRAISKRYKHTKKNGGKDLRFKDNFLIVTYNTTVKCGDCSHSWIVRSEKEFAS